MLGRVRRPSMSSLEQLELERPPPKVIKDDPLSIYENTLRKLKEGSQCCQSLPPEKGTNADNGDIASCCSPDTVNPYSSSSDCSHNSSSHQSRSLAKEKRNKNISVLYLFSKYKIPTNNPNLPDEEAMVTENAYSAFSISPTLNQWRFMSNSGQHIQDKCIDSLVI